MFDAGLSVGRDCQSGHSLDTHGHLAPVAEISPRDQAVSDFHIDTPEDWQGTNGARLPFATKISVRLAGRIDAPIVAVLGGISANRIVADNEAEAGWWSNLVGVGRPLDLGDYCIASMDFVAGDGVSPIDTTPADQANLFKFALGEINIQKIHAFIGASFGGMTALSFARQFPEDIDKLIVVCAAHRPSPMAQAWRSVQRQILSFAIEAGKPEEGIAIARSLAMTTYRSSQEYDERFNCAAEADGGVADYLRARGEDYVPQTTAARYLSLSGAIDCHFETPEEITTPTLLIAADSDQIAPLADVEELAARLSGPVQFQKISSLYGHDAFLKDTDTFAPQIKAFVSKENS